MHRGFQRCSDGAEFVMDGQQRGDNPLIQACTRGVPSVPTRATVYVNFSAINGILRYRIEAGFGSFGTGPASFNILEIQPIRRDRRRPRPARGFRAERGGPPPRRGEPPLETLEPLLSDGRPDPAFLFGPTGVGKTCIARYTLAQLREQEPAVRVAYANCWQEYTRFRVLYRILEGVDRAVDVHRSTPKDELFERLSRTDDEPIVVILDEVDQLEETAALYDLHRLGHVSPVLIANREEELFASFDDRVRSRFHAGTRVRFDRYGTDELAAILAERAEKALEPGVVTDSQLRTVADAASGDARVGIGMLRSAARRAERQGLASITDDALEAAIPDARTAIRRKTVEGLIEHQRVLSTT